MTPLLKFVKLSFTGMKPTVLAERKRKLKEYWIKKMTPTQTQEAIQVAG